MANCKECYYYNTGFCYRFQEPITNDDNDKCFVPSSLETENDDLALTANGALNIKIYRCEVNNPVSGSNRFVYHVFVNEEFTRAYDDYMDLLGYITFLTCDYSSYWGSNHE